VKVNKPLFFVGLVMLLWFVVLEILGIVAMEPFVVAFWSILVMSIIFLISGLVLTEKKGD